MPYIENHPRFSVWLLEIRCISHPLLCPMHIPAAFNVAHFVCLFSRSMHKNHWIIQKCCSYCAHSTLLLAIEWKNQSRYACVSCEFHSNFNAFYKIIAPMTKKKQITRIDACFANRCEIYYKLLCFARIILLLCPPLLLHWIIAFIYIRDGFECRCGWLWMMCARVILCVLNYGMQWIWMWKFQLQMKLTFGRAVTRNEIGATASWWSVFGGHGQITTNRLKIWNSNWPVFSEFSGRK